VTSSEPKQPTVRDVIDPIEVPHPDHREHAKTPKHVSDQELEERTQHERQIVDAGSGD
jgi:hypothetical protein